MREPMSTVYEKDESRRLVDCNKPRKRSSHKVTKRTKS